MFLSFLSYLNVLNIYLKWLESFSPQGFCSIRTRTLQSAGKHRNVNEDLFTSKGGKNFREHFYNKSNGKRSFLRSLEVRLHGSYVFSRS